MGRSFGILGALVLLLLGAGAAIHLTGQTLPLILWLFGPSHGWEPSLQAPAPDYTQAEAWAARPGQDSFALLAPAGVEQADGARDADVFFVHPTGHLNGADWNSPLDPNSRTEENTRWMMANQASAFSGCCNVWAPRYREASIFRYLGAPPEIAEKAMDLAYSDVERAFLHFLDRIQGRPFFIASHSQGTTHAFRLIQEHVDDTPLASRLIAAYLIGSRVTNAEADALKTVPVCQSESQTGCIVHWATWGEGGKPDDDPAGRLVCVNPLTWTRDGARAPAALHRGAVPISGRFSIRIWGDDAPQGVEFGPLGAPIEALTWAACRDGRLYVADQGGGPFDRFDLGGKNYHGLDYPLFHMDIRDNARLRAAVHRKRTAPDPPGAGGHDPASVRP